MSADAGRRKLSDTMRLALLAIYRQGGLAKAEGGGWWRGGDDCRLFIAPEDGNIWVGTRTIYALFDRDLLQRQYLGVQHKDTYELTDAGRRVAEGGGRDG